MKSRSVTVRTTPWLPAISCPRRPVCGKPGNEQKVTLWARNSSRFIIAPCIRPAISRGRLKMHWWGPPLHWTALRSSFISHWVFAILYPAWDHPAPCFLLDLLFPTCKKFPSNPGLLGAPPTLLASSLLGSSASALSCLQNALPGTPIAVSQVKSLFRYQLLSITGLWNTAIFPSHTWKSLFPLPSLLPCHRLTHLFFVFVIFLMVSQECHSHHLH